MALTTRLQPLAALLVAATPFICGSARAVTFYFGEDINPAGRDNAPRLGSYPNSRNAEQAFLGALAQGVRIEDWEDFGCIDPGVRDNCDFRDSAGRPLPVPGRPYGNKFSAGEHVNLPRSTAVQFRSPTNPADIVRASINFRNQDEARLYYLPGTSTDGTYGGRPISNDFVLRTRSDDDFNLNFDQPVRAFGGYGIDVGDYNGGLSMRVSYADGTSENFTVGPDGVTSFTKGRSASTSGSILYFGFITEKDFNSVEFIASSGGQVTNGERFYFDNWTIALAQDVAVPGPLGAASLAVLPFIARLRRRYGRGNADGT
jgi:hypothetical protein